MFQHLSPAVQSKRKQKSVILMQNGQPMKMFRLDFVHQLIRQQIIKSVEKNWSLGIHKNIRIFSIQGIEYQQQDLLYVKNEQRLYISRGEQFDSNSNFGQFQIIKKLGEGGFGTVDLAKNIITGEYAAIKVLKVSKNSTSTDIDMIFKEAENLKSLNHPHIVKILNCYALSDMKVVIVMEYLEGGELLELLKQKKKFEENQAKFYFKQIINAVSYCHRQGIVHRDLKLQNILLKNSKVLKVADFGISGVADRFNPQADWGTLRYMAPQVLSGKNKVNSPFVDIWACGIILYLMVTGEVPFNGISTSDIIDSITKKSLVFPSSLMLTQKCKSLIQKMLEKNPYQRIQMSDIESDPWLTQRQERIHNTLKTVSSQQVAVKLNELKKQQRKSINLPRPSNVKIPKRLEKQKDQLLEQLRVYKGKRSAKSQVKFFPKLKNRRGKYQQVGKISKQSFIIENKKKQGSQAWK